MDFQWCRSFNPKLWEVQDFALFSAQAKKYLQNKMIDANLWKIFFSSNFKKENFMHCKWGGPIYKSHTNFDGWDSSENDFEKDFQ